MIESKPLTTELETMPTETTTTTTSHEANGPVTTTVSDPVVGANHIVTPAPETTTGPDDIDYDAADFAAALENFDREQAEDKAAASAAMEEDKVITGTVVKITDKYVVVDIGLKSEGLKWWLSVRTMRAAISFRTRRHSVIVCGISWRRLPRIRLR